MTEEKKELDELARAKARIAELERELARRGKKKMLTTSTITAPPMIGPRPNIVISTTQKRPHVLGGKPMLQIHNLPPPKSAEDLTSEILTRVKGDRISVVTKKEAKTK